MSDEDKFLETMNLLSNDESKADVDDVTPLKLIGEDDNINFEPTFQVFNLQLFKTTYNLYCVII